MTVTISAPETIRKAVGVRLIRWEWRDYLPEPVVVDECNLHNWKPYSGKLDWSAVEGDADWSVYIVYDDGSDYPLVSVVNTCNPDCKAFNLYADGKLTERPVRSEQIVPTARLFLSVAVARDRLTIGAEHYEQLGVVMTKKPATLRIVGKYNG